MPDDPRIQRLLDELLESGGSPEQVCAGCPELLPRVRTRWRQIRRLTFDLDSFFPPSGGRREESPALPVVPGYRVESVLGRGGMGIVFRARHLRLNRPVALKMILSGAYAARQELDRFVQEAEAVASLRHPNIVQVYDAGDIDGRPYFTMELVEGGRLSQKVAGVPQPAREAAELVAELAGAVHAAHEKGIVHRDLNPSNILLADDGTPKVTDFGLARRLEEGGKMTLTGLPIGTPSYMAPEQACGDSAAIGRATDVYALGAILYDLLTGRPPFRADTATATLQQVMTGDIVRPTRLNPRTPRDLETICLKCLQKQPARRYPSAAALAEDLHHFLRDEPIAARPPGRAERFARWLRHHPARATSMAAALLLALSVAGAGGWIIGQRTRIARIAESDLRKAVEFQQRSELPQARKSLLDAQAIRRGAAPGRTRVLLDQALHDQDVLERLESIRMTRSTFVDGRDNHLADVRFNNVQADRNYEEAFRDAALGAPPGDPDGAARRVKSSAVRVPLVAALDDWAVCAPDGPRRNWLLRVARGADPNPWRDRARAPAAWEDARLLAELAGAAPVAEQRLPLLLAVGERLQLAGADGLGLLRRVQQQYPDDFWANFVLARVLHGVVVHGTVDWTETAAFYEKALGVRPNAVAVRNNLALVRVSVGWLDDNADGRRGPGAITLFREALRSDPDFAPARNNLALCLKHAGIWWVAIHEYRDALRADPALAPAHFGLGEMNAGSGHINDAIDHYRAALRVDPDFALAHYFLGIALLDKGRFDAVYEDFPEGDESLNHFRASALSEAIAAYWKSYECEPGWALAPNALRIPRQDVARLDEAIDHYRQAVLLEPGRFRSHGALGQALLVKWQLAESDAALARCQELLPPEETKVRGNVERLRGRCHRLLVLQGRIGDIVRGTDRPAAGECLDAAEACYVKQHFATAARLYAEALETAPKVTDDLRAGHRFNAACAAALAGCGRGDDAAGVSDGERARLREQARAWLRLDLAQWTRGLGGTDVAGRLEAHKALMRWRDDPDLAGLRDATALDGMPPAERSECRALWAEVEANISAARRAR